MMNYYIYHVIGFIATFAYLFWVLPKYGVKRFNGLALATCTYLTAYALMLVLFWIITGNFGGQNVIRVFLFVPLILLLYANTFDVDLKVSLDFAAPVLCIAQAFGKIGCTVSGCCESFIEVPWGVYNAYTETRLFPVQICEGITALIIAISVIIMAFRQDFRCRGTTMAWMWVMFGSTRVIWEFFRANEKLFLGLSELALWSIALTVAGVIWLVLDKKKGEKEI
jgi:phosphatidylglycerol:prolipoprotein diacylglycerol transferase